MRTWTGQPVVTRQRDANKDKRTAGNSEFGNCTPNRKWKPSWQRKWQGLLRQGESKHGSIVVVVLVGVLGCSSSESPVFGRSLTLATSEFSLSKTNSDFVILKVTFALECF